GILKVSRSRLRTKNDSNIRKKDGHESRPDRGASGLNLQSKRFPERSQGPNPKTCLLVFGVALILFVLIAAEVVNAGALTLLDARINVGLHSNTRPGLIEFFIWVSKLHSNWSTTIVTGAIAVYLWIRRLHYWILILAISVWGGVLLN